MRKTRGERAFNVFNILLLSLLTISFFYPFWHVLCASFSDPNIMRRHTGLLLWPQEFTTMGYQLVMPRWARMCSPAGCSCSRAP